MNHSEACTALEAAGGDRMTVLKILFPALMVIGALGSLVVNLVSHGHYAMSLQWIGAALLYTALMIRNWR